MWCRAGVTVRDVLLVACLAAKIHGGQDAIDKVSSAAPSSIPPPFPRGATRSFVHWPRGPDAAEGAQFNSPV